ncbi:Crp/Fnr family transcriptional regulator [Roseateles aquatilis]|uniref:Crp/Fnr family transcriptional regulator n=1 Tax=Roseateles aquatilis TaxID=431061 RepID=UPI0011313502|nr:Crp/Fnr family transcriptional regulator [Roseateles aquatilis]
MTSDPTAPAADGAPAAPTAPTAPRGESDAVHPANPVPLADAIDAIDAIAPATPSLPTSAGLIPGPSQPIPWRALLGDVLLDVDSWADLSSMTRLHRYRHGEMPVRRGEPAAAMLALCEGRVSLLKGSVAAPCWLDLHSAWFDGRHEEGASVASPTALVMAWPMAVAVPWLRGHPLVLEALIRAVAVQLRGAHGEIHALTTQDATGRIAAWLLSQAGAAHEIRLSERKRDVAARLSISPETLSRTLRQLADRGVLAVQGYRIGLLDRVELLALARCRQPV